MAKEGITRFVTEIKFNWDYYTELRHRAMGECNIEARETLDVLNNYLSISERITTGSGYMIELDGKPFDFIEAFSGVSRTRIVEKRDALELAEALGYCKDDVVKIK